MIGFKIRAPLEGANRAERGSESWPAEGLMLTKDEFR